MGEDETSPAVRRLVELVAEYPEGLRIDALRQAARSRFPRLPDQRVAQLVEQAVRGGALVAVGEVISVPAASQVPAEATPQDDRGLRVVVLDAESVVRTTSVEPYAEKRIFQVGVVRTGTDSTWIAEATTFERFLLLPDETWIIRSTKVQDQYHFRATEPAEALRSLHEFCADADLIVTYNGTTADLPMLREAFAREGLPELDLLHVDAYYLALSLWPTARSHRLGELADTLNIASSVLSWHDALDDAELLSRLLWKAAEHVRGWTPGLRSLIAAVCHDSNAWQLLLKLAGAKTEASSFSHSDVAEVLAAELAEHSPRRREQGEPRQPVHLADSLLDEAGRVNPGRLAAAVRGQNARPRPAQEMMATALHRWADDGVPALIEAPTGTGKSYAILAAAMDWLAGGRERTVIVTTFTRQLQAQLADDVAALEHELPELGLLATSDVVKGQGNRLSLRALTSTLADASARPAARRPRQRIGFVADIGFRELAAFLALRFIAAKDVAHGWVARSVDLVDVPAFFSDYCGRDLPVWLHSLSQETNGDFPSSATNPVALHTDAVREALTSHRLLLANHALLLSHLDDLADLGPETLLIVDEAHQLEDAATSALSTTIDYRSVVNLQYEVTAWLASAESGPQLDTVRTAVDHLGLLLDHEQLPRVAAHAFDAKGAGVGNSVGGRSVTLASEYSGTSIVRQVRTLMSLMTRLAGLCEALGGALGSYLGAHRSSMNLFDIERLQGLLAQTALVRTSSRAIVDDVEDIIGRLDAQPALSAEVPDGGEAPDPDDDPAVNLAEDAGDYADSDPGDEVATEVRLGDLPPGTSNRVVYAEELGALRGELRSYKFRVVSSPVELGEDIGWLQFLQTFVRTYFVSATLRVEGRWDFISARLGLSEDIATLALPTPFDLAEQAELVCFSDFPSWAEQSDGAMRTVAHQLAGYAAEVVRAPSEDEFRSGHDGGAMVLTTARSTAGGIAEYLATELRRCGDETPVLSALGLGNARGVQKFTDPEDGGGFLVGTRGLWQGVDVADPERLRMVWINKLPFAPFAAPVIEARRAVVAERALAAGAEDPDAVATQLYYLPLAALQLRQAAGRLIRSERHRGVIVISDRKLAGRTALRRTYRQTFLGSLDAGLLRPDPETGEAGAGNVVTMAEGWDRIWSFLCDGGLIDPDRAAKLRTPRTLEEHTMLPHTRKIAELRMTPAEIGEHRAAGTLAAEILERSAKVAGLLAFRDEPVTLKESQRKAIERVALGGNVLGLLPTGFGKSYCFQLPALVMPGVTIVVSPLVALMTDQALGLNRSIGGAVRALVSTLRESSSRAGKTEVAEQLLGREDHGIRMIYVSPERLCQRRFRELVRRAVKAGTVTRIAFDEAHTLVQWDDFRPAMKRVERFLEQLRLDDGLPLTALTATANRTVLAGLREGVFGLPPAADRTLEEAEAASGALLTVRENPIRPELAVFRRSIDAAGPMISAGLAEEVIGAIEDHAIFYCLTVKEVVALHAHLRDFLGDAEIRVHRFHGRLTEAEKSAVLTEFREAPRRGEEGFAPMVVVATSAFGLGIDRPDVRSVFCASAPTDLAALYQQIGRAGRDSAGQSASDDGDLVPPANVGLALLTTRGLRTVAFMTGSDLSASLLRRMARAVLDTRGVLDAAQVADTLMTEDLAAGRLTPDRARHASTTDAYVAGVARAFAALAGLGIVDDLGDFPPLATVKAGELLEGNSRFLPADDPITAAVVSAVLDVPSRGIDGELNRSRLSVACLDRMLAEVVPRYREVAEDTAGTWQLLADLHDSGALDVSAAPSRRLVTGLSVRSRRVPPEFETAVAGKSVRAAEELRLLQDFFRDSAVCANRKLADYFGVAELPADCCSNATNRCSACWDAGEWPPGEVKPKVAVALETPRPRPAGARTDAAFARRRLDEKVYRLVWDVYYGVRALDLFRSLRGEESYYVPTIHKRVRLRSALINSRYFGSGPGVRMADIDESLARLEHEGKVVRQGPLWREAEYVAREAARAAEAATTAATGTGR